MYFIECWEAEREGDAIRHVPIYVSEGFDREGEARTVVNKGYIDPWKVLRVVETTPEGPRVVMARSGHRAGQALPRRFHPNLPASGALPAGTPGVVS